MGYRAVRKFGRAGLTAPAPGETEPRRADFAAKAPPAVWESGNAVGR